MAQTRYQINSNSFTPISTKGKLLTSRDIIRVTNSGDTGLNPGKYVRFNSGKRIEHVSLSALLAFYNRVILPTPDNTWMIPELGENFYYSTDNSKIILAGLKLDKSNPISFGLPAVISCMFAGACKDYCYAEGINKQYWATMRYQFHNYYLVWLYRDNPDKLTRMFDEMIKTSETELLRFDDFGDIIHYNELVAIVQAARLNPETIIYGYTKSTGIVLSYLENGNTFPDNFRLNISSTDNYESQINATKLVQNYGMITCYILETGVDIKDWYKSGLPFNDGEMRAIMSDTDFAIALHGTFKKGTNEYKADLVGRVLNGLGIETC